MFKPSRLTICFHHRRGFGIRKIREGLWPGGKSCQNNPRRPVTGQHWNLLYLDHDLGVFSGAGGRERTGYDIACWLEQNPQHLPDRIEVVSNNPAGKRNIEMALQRCRR